MEHLTPQYMIPGYSPEIHGTGDIREEDVCRARNHKWSQRYIKDGDHTQWERKSAAACPAYGNCNRCFSSGPLRYTFCILFHAAFLHHYIVDAEAFSQVLHKPHEVAKANWKYMWFRERSRELDPERVSFAIQRDYPNGEDFERVRELNRAFQMFCEDMV